jgi:hypothetical protein
VLSACFLTIQAQLAQFSISRRFSTQGALGVPQKFFIKVRYIASPHILKLGVSSGNILYADN